MTDFSQGPMHPIWIDVVAAVRALMDSFTTEGLGNPEPSLSAALSKLETDGGRAATYALVAFAGACIRWAAAELDRSESDVLAELARGVGVEA